jgi:hypothetical protein
LDLPIKRDVRKAPQDRYVEDQPSEGLQRRQLDAAQLIAACSVFSGFHQT